MVCSNDADRTVSVRGSTATTCRDSVVGSGRSSSTSIRTRPRRHDHRAISSPLARSGGSAGKKPSSKARRPSSRRPSRRAAIRRTPSVRRSSPTCAASGTSTSTSRKRPANSIFGQAAPTRWSVLDAAHQRPQPTRLHGGVVVDEGDEVELTRRPDPEVAAAGEPGVRQWFDDADRRHLGAYPLDDVVERPVVDHHDLEPIGWPVGRHDGSQAVDRHLPAVEVQHDDAHEGRGSVHAGLRGYRRPATEIGSCVRCPDDSHACKCSSLVLSRREHQDRRVALRADQPMRSRRSSIRR